ncbi:MAG: RNA polymerase sporulation sigma factor SigK [Coprobacillus sp.]|nr:RNA polymerase sporulation sigma factor SigK [Coprobacillus sp.]MDY4144972.1 RNA polymerase sporulation sigma factor SigK [Bacilli bacterium]
MILPLLGSIASNSFPEVLSPEEEKLYLEKFKNGDSEARNALIEHNLRLVAHIVKKFENTKEDKDDLLSIGSMGLIKAIDTYNFDNNAKLSTYASRCIENEILMHLRQIKNQKQTTCLYAKIGEDKEGNEIHLSDVIEDPSIPISIKLENEETIREIKESLKQLSDREYTIIKYRYGLDNTLPMTQRELAKYLNISRSYVSRIEKRALTKLYLEIKNNHKNR